MLIGAGGGGSGGGARPFGGANETALLREGRPCQPTPFAHVTGSDKPCVARARRARARENPPRIGASERIAPSAGTG